MKIYHNTMIGISKKIRIMNFMKKDLTAYFN